MAMSIVCPMNRMASHGIMGPVSAEERMESPVRDGAVSSRGRGDNTSDELIANKNVGEVGLGLMETYKGLFLEITG
jgi:hypothetical protein